jgi:hypothetical protein
MVGLMAGEGALSKTMIVAPCESDVEVWLRTGIRRLGGGIELRVLFCN